MQSPGMRQIAHAILTVILSLALALPALYLLHVSVTASGRGLGTDTRPVFPITADTITADTITADTITADTITPTHQVWLPHVSGPSAARVVIAAAHVDSAVSHEPDEAVLLWNAGGTAQPLAGWSIHANSRHVTFPVTTTLTLAPHARLWCAAQAAAFRASFGEEPACAWDDDSGAPDHIVPLGGNMTLPNGGASLQLRDDQNQLIDTLLYGDVERAVEGWTGTPAQLYSDGAIGTAGQVWHRKLDPSRGMPLDTDQAVDWAGDRADLAWGRRVRKPGWRGWDAGDFGVPTLAPAVATTTVAVGPEGLYQAIADALEDAQAAVDMSVYTLEHPQLTAVLTAALARGVSVRILLEGSPPGGITDEQRWCVAQLAAAGADVRYMAPRDDAPRGYAARYLFSHAKYLLIDDRRALVGTDNFNLDSMPVPADTPVGGRRGFYLLTDAWPVVSTLRAIFDHDWRPDAFLDLMPYTPEHERYGDPPADFVWPEPPVYAVAASPFSDVVSETGATQFAVIAAPENALRPDAGLFALLAQAGAGDAIYLEQLYEHKHWGESTSNPIADANPRLLAVIDAARRGATVRVLLDSFFDDGEALRSNRATVDYLRAVAAAEGLDLEARVANPTGGGIHAKLLLMRVGGAHWSAVGSLNGSETSHKLNREIVLLVDAPAVHARLRDVFLHDWATASP